MRFIRDRFAIFGIACVLVAAGCATNPVSGKREFTLVSGEQEQSLGSEGYKGVVSEYGIYDERPALQAYVDTVGQRLARVSHRPDLTWRFTLVDDAAVNAFAMPGGYIYVTRGILAHLNSEAQLAGVLGHEIGHVTARHSARQITQQQLSGIGLGLAGAISPTFRRFGGIAESALQLVFLKYSRDDETQADELGIEYATKAGYDPREIPATYAMLKRISERGGQRLPGFLSTHPDPGDREARTTELSRAAAAGKSGLVVRELIYVDHLEGMVFGRDPREGYFEGTQYYQPTLGFQMGFPAGWTLQDSRNAVAAGEPNQHAAMQLTLAPPASGSPGAYVDELQRTGKISGAVGRSETIGGYPAWVGRLTVPGQNGASTTLTAGFVRQTPERMYQVLGKSTALGDADEQAIVQSLRSFRGLNDPARQNPTPDRVDVAVVPTTTTFEAAVKALEPNTRDLEEVAILNNTFVDQPARKGERIKLIRPGRVR